MAEQSRITGGFTDRSIKQVDLIWNDEGEPVRVGEVADNGTARIIELDPLAEGAYQARWVSHASYDTTVKPAFGARTAMSAPGAPSGDEAVLVCRDYAVTDGALTTVSVAISRDRRISVSATRECLTMGDIQHQSIVESLYRSAKDLLDAMASAQRSLDQSDTATATMATMSDAARDNPAFVEHLMQFIDGHMDRRLLLHNERHAPLAIG